ncbi:MAG: YibE/F family protein [Defluviitaleaceae bacterium]|nr:YibE/F family protein [Defluviitaleaceae bacterium]
MKQKIVYAAVIVFSVLFLFIGNLVTSRGTSQGEGDDLSFYSGVVTQIVDRVVSDQFGFVNTTIYFQARISSGQRRGEVVYGEQHKSDFFILETREIEAGDRIMLVHDPFGQQFFFAEFIRINTIAIMGVAFLVLVILFGRIKGLNAIVALGFTCMAVFLVFVPAILAGMNIYVATIIVCIYSIISTLLIVIGPNKKALSAMLGCFGGVLIAGVLMLAMGSILELTGLVDQETQVLLMLENPIDLRAIIFAGVILGAVGAIMDVAMSIASSLWEIREAGGVSDFGSLVKSGITIGKDILGTMLNTLILAYIGSSLSLILLINVHTTSYLELFNMEFIVVEFLRALVGSFGMFLTIPLTAGVCGWLYSIREIFPPEPDNTDEFYEDYYRRNMREAARKS